jgi:preprotein translocase subunit SecD
MSKRIRNRLLITFAVTVFSVFLFAGFPPSVANIQERIRLGLDLQGGAQLVMGVVTDDAIRAETDNAVDRMRDLLDTDGITYRQATRVTEGRFQFVGVDPSRDSEFRQFMTDQFPEWRIASTDGDVPNTYVVQLDLAAEIVFRDQAVGQAIQTIRNRIDELGVTEPVIQEHGGPGEYEILVELPAVEDPDRVKDIMQSTALLELKLVVPGGGPFASRPEALTVLGGTLPLDVELVQSVEDELVGLGGEAWYAVERVASITGRDLNGASVSRDQNGRPAVSFNLTRDGSQRFGNTTGNNIGRLLAIILDGRIQSAPVINGRITNQGIIEGGPGGFTLQEANDLSLILRSGAMPASLEYLEERLVGASLGADSIRQGMVAGIVALVVVLLFMLVYYKLSGVNAAVAMVLNIVILFGALAYFEAVLTLPGIAGIILTIGVGIDSNILIFERIREELRSGKTAVSSVVTAFNRVFVTIVDTHLAAMISAMFLFLFGTGSVRGFAVTLMIGLTANVFTSVFVSRTLFEWLLGRSERVPSLSI